MNTKWAGKLKGAALVYLISAFSIMVFGGYATSSLPSCPSNGNVDSPVLYLDKVKVSGPDKPMPKTELDYTLRIDIRYCDSTAIRNVKVHDNIPNELSVDSTSATKGTVFLGGSTKDSSTPIKWDIGSMGPGDTESLTIDMHTALRQQGSSGKFKQNFLKSGTTYELNKGASATGDHATAGTVSAGPTPPITVTTKKRPRGG